MKQSTTASAKNVSSFAPAKSRATIKALNQDYAEMRSAIIDALRLMPQDFCPFNFAKKLQFNITNVEKQRLCIAIMQKLCIEPIKIDKGRGTALQYSRDKRTWNTLEKRLSALQVKYVVLSNNVFQHTGRIGKAYSQIIQDALEEVKSEIASLPRDEQDFVEEPVDIFSAEEVAQLSPEATKISSSYNEKTGEFEYVHEDLHVNLEKIDDSITEVKLSIAKETERLKKLRSERDRFVKQIEDREMLISICENAGISLEELKRLVNKA
jgi:predicted  nucleic acid-binding Zn-ribbon protein